MDKIFRIILFVTLPLYVGFSAYYTMLLYDFSWWGFAVTFLLTLLPTIVGVIFGYYIKNKKI